jgi:diguanylate cyclase (GGDEF)-like protein
MDFLAERDGLWLRMDDAALSRVMGMLGEDDGSSCFVLPIIARDEVAGLLLIGASDKPDQHAGIQQQIRDLGSRLGVALATHAHEAQLVFLAHHDGLTGLPNRLFLSERLQRELSYARRQNTQLALLFIDLDRFKNINDTLGHEVGDRLLCQVAQRLGARVRDCDTVARLGGDEFVILQTGVHSPPHAAKLAESVLQALAQPFQIADTESFVGGSIGIAVYPDDGQCAEDLLKHADIAMYRAKAAGRGRLVFFEDRMNLELRERSLLEQELHQAIARNQLSVQYQPRVRLKDGRWTGAEALVRWQHPELGWVSPARFIPLAEDSGLIDQIGLWVLRQVCSQLALWKAAGLAIGSVAVNVSGRQFRTTHLVDQVRDALAVSGLAPESLELEVTEGILIDDVGFVLAILNQLKQTGVSLALDDFGTGYSSMAYLKHLPFDVLKIDQSFVRDLDQDEASRRIVQAVIALAHALDKSVVAEGVETQYQADLLLAWGCEEVQGYYFARPMMAQAFEDTLRESAGG